MSQINNFSCENGRVILIDILKTVNQTENAKRINEAKAQAGKEMIKIMQYVFPLIMELQMEVIQNYGFPANREGELTINP